VSKTHSSEMNVVSHYNANTVLENQNQEETVKREGDLVVLTKYKITQSISLLT